MKQPDQTRIVPAAEFKATCLALMDEVQENGAEIVITKHRQPVAKLVPALRVSIAFIGRSPGVMEATDDLISPVGPDWEVDADL